MRGTRTASTRRAQLGTFDRASAGQRYGGETAGGVNYRVFGKYFERDDTLAPVADRRRCLEAWRMSASAPTGTATARDSFTVQGDAYSGEQGQLLPAITVIGRPGPAGPLNVDVSGGNLLARWRRSYDDSLRHAAARLLRLHATRRPELPGHAAHLRPRLAAPLRRLCAATRSSGAPPTASPPTATSAGLICALDPEDSDDQLFSGFIQDQISLSELLRVTLGTKLEHNDFSGFEVQPSVRVAWLPRDNHTLWAAISRAVRVPTRFERDVAVDASDPAGNPVVRLVGNDDFESED